MQTLRLNRISRVECRRERNEFNALLAEAVALTGRLEQETATPFAREIIVHLKREIESLQAELAVAIPFISPQDARNE